MALQNVRRCFIQGVRAQAGTKMLFKLAGAQTNQIHALANDFTDAAKGFEFGPDVPKDALRESASLLRRD